MAVSRMNALTTARWGLTSAEHYYGLPEALFEDRVVQNFPLDYDYNDEYFRFSISGQMFKQGAKPGSAKWNEVLEQFLALGFTFVPTFTIYDANRDLMRARQADWHKEYAWKSMWNYFQPQRGGHGSYWYRWSTQNEVEWNSLSFVSQNGSIPVSHQRTKESAGLSLYAKRVWYSRIPGRDTKPKAGSKFLPTCLKRK